MHKLVAKLAQRVRRWLPGAKAEAVWFVVANVDRERPVGGSRGSRRPGRKHFRPGTLVYCPTVLWGDGYEKIKIVARHRGSHRFVTMVIRASGLTNWRAKLVYSPQIITEFQKMGATWDGSEKSKRLAGRLVEAMRKRLQTGESCG